MEKFDYNKKDKFFWKYNDALEHLEKIVSSFIREVEYDDEHNPIEHYSSRIKSIESIYEKLQKRGLEFNAYNIENNLMDVAGIRIVCHFKNDLYRMIELIRKDLSIDVVCEKDYINNPKKSGYSSYHMIVKVPIIDNDKFIYVPVEIQIRTLAKEAPLGGASFAFYIKIY